MNYLTNKKLIMETKLVSPASKSAAASKDSNTAAKKLVPPGPVANTIMTAEYVKNIATYAYLWAWPMENIHNRKSNI
jgi:hypothetical protein